MLEHLNEVNDVKILSVFDDEFKTYGNVIPNYDFSKLTTYMENNTDIPESGNIYVASVAEMESEDIVNTILLENYTFPVNKSNG